MKLRRESTKVIKEKIKKETVDAITESIAGEVANEVSAATARATTAEVKRAEVDSARIARRQVDVALREAQREVAQAQLEIQREVQAQVREQTREQVRAARGSGRGVGAGAGRGSGVETADGGRYTTQESKTFSVSGSPRVNIGTFDGPVTVHGWDRSEVMFTAIKRADGEEELKQISVRSEQQGSTISIVAHSEEQIGSVQLDVYVPRRSSLHVSSDDGHLNLEGVSGDITLRTGDGAIEVNGGSGQLDVNTGDGRIHVMDFEGQVDARTGDGAISLDGNFKALSARTGDGSISLTVPAGSNFTIETNADDTVSNEGLTIAEDIAPSKRVKRWKVGSGGNVFVLNTGDGRIVLRSR